MLPRPLFSAANEERFQTACRQRSVAISKRVVYFTMVNLVLFTGWDALIDAEQLIITIPIRIGCIAYFVFLAVMTGNQRVTSSNRLWLLLVASANAALTLDFALILAVLPNGAFIGVPGHIIVIVTIPTLISGLRPAAVCLLPMLILPNLVMLISGEAAVVVINANIWIVSAASLTLLVSYFFELLDRRAFALELSVEAEKERADDLLRNILPVSIAEELKEHHRTVPQNIPAASVLFADLAGFTRLAQDMPAEKLVGLLDELFTSFDQLSHKLGAEKIKTIGDSYMAATGVPSSQEDHAERAVKLALAMQDAQNVFNGRHGLKLKLRIGINSGSLVAGVIGQHKFAYDLWGDTVNVAQRMEAHGVAGEIQISEPTKTLLPPGYIFRAQGSIDLKGHDPIDAYFVNRA